MAAGSFPVTVTFAGEALSDGGNNAIAVFVPVIPPPPPSGEFSVSDTAGVPADGESAQTVTVDLHAGNGTPLSGAEGGLSGRAGAATVSAFAETQTAGTYTASVTSTTAGSFPVTVTFGDVELSAGVNNATARFVAPPPPPPPTGEFAVSATPDVPADGETAQTVTVRVWNADGDPVAGVAEQLSANAGTATVSAFAETQTAGTYTASVISTTAGSFPVTVTLAGVPVSPGANNATAVFVTPPPPPPPVVSIADSDYAASTASAPADGSSPLTITITLRDAARAPVLDRADLLRATAGGATVSAFTETATRGTYTAEVTSSTAGSFNVAAFYDSQPLPHGLANAVVVFSPVPGEPLDVSITVNPRTDIVGEPVTVEVTVRDAGGSPVERASVHLWTMPALAQPLDVTGFTGAAGRFVREFTSRVVGQFSVYATVDDVPVPGAPVSVTFVARPTVSLQDSSVEVFSGPRIPADGSSAQLVTVYLRSADLAPMGGLAGSLVGAAGDAQVSAFTETETGVYSAFVTSRVPGAFAVDVFFEGTRVPTSGNAIATFVEAAAPSSPPASSPSPSPSPGTSSPAAPTPEPSPSVAPEQGGAPSPTPTPSTPTDSTAPPVVTKPEAEELGDVVKGTQPKTGAGDLFGLAGLTLLLAGLGLALTAWTARRRKAQGGGLAGGGTIGR
jgi:adhesin/invasin